MYLISPEVVAVIRQKVRDLLHIDSVIEWSGIANLTFVRRDLGRKARERNYRPVKIYSTNISYRRKDFKIKIYYKNCDTLRFILLIFYLRYL